MVVLGLILVLVAVVAGGVLVYENGGNTAKVSAFGGEWQVHVYWLAVIGAAILLVAVLGIALMRAGGRRGLRRRQERKQLKRENAALADRVRREQQAAAETRHGVQLDGRDDAAAGQPHDPLAKHEERAYEQSPTVTR